MFFGLFNPLSKEDQLLKDFLISIIGINPKRLSFYKRAFLHKSFKKNSNDFEESNERLEFLGDSVLNTVVSDYLYKHYPLRDEGFLTNMRSKVVNRNFLNELALEIEIDSFLKKNIQHDIAKTSIYGNALEALIGAIYLDKGFKYTYNYICERLIFNKYKLEDLELDLKNSKSLILEWAQKNNVTYSYQITDNEEKNSAKRFKALLSVNKFGSFVGFGSSKKSAELNAAETAWKRISKDI